MIDQADRWQVEQDRRLAALERKVDKLVEQISLLNGQLKDVLGNGDSIVMRMTRLEAQQRAIGWIGTAFRSTITGVAVGLILLAAQHLRL